MIVRIGARIARVLLVVVGAACVGVLVIVIGSGCGQTVGPSNNDASDAADASVEDANTPTCFYNIPDGAPQTCPADGKTLCLAADGCNSCHCLVRDGGPPMLAICTGRPCNP